MIDVRTLPRRSLWAFVLGLLLVCGISCEGSGAHASRPPALRVGYGPWPGFDVFAYAEAAGRFEARGIEVELVRLDNQFDAARALRKGKLDVAFASVSDIMLHPTPSPEDTPVIFLTNFSHGADGIIARPGVESIAELRGKKISAKLGSVHEVILAEGLSTLDVTCDEVEVVDLTNAAAYARFVSGELDAAVLWEPQLSRAQQETGGNIVFRTDQVESLVFDVAITRTSVLRDKLKQLDALALVWLDVVHAVETRSDVVFDRVSRELGQSKEEFARGYAGLLPGTLALNRSMLVDGGFDTMLPRLRGLLKKSRASPLGSVTYRADVMKRAVAVWTPND